MDEPRRRLAAVLGHAGRHAPALDAVRRRRGGRAPVQQGQRPELRPRGSPADLRALHEQPDPRRGRRLAHGARLALAGQGAQQPERRRRRLRTARSSSPIRPTAAGRASASSASRSSTSRASTASTPDGELSLLVDDFQKPNGLCFSPDEKTLWINDTDGGHIRRFSVGSDGSLSGGEVIYQMEGFSLETGIPDGQKLDAAGNLWVSGPGGLHVVTGEASCSAASSRPRTSATRPGAARTGRRSSSAPPPRCTRCARRSRAIARPP